MRLVGRRRERSGGNEKQKKCRESEDVAFKFEKKLSTRRNSLRRTTEVCNQSLHFPKLVGDGSKKVNGRANPQADFSPKHRFQNNYFLRTI